MDALTRVKGWIGGLTEIGLMLLAFAIVCSLLVGANLPFFGGVVANMVSLIKELGANGLVGLIALGRLLLVGRHRRVGSDFGVRPTGALASEPRGHDDPEGVDDR